MALLVMKAALNSVITKSGAVFVMMAGVMWMLMLLADKLVFLE